MRSPIAPVPRPVVLALSAGLLLAACGGKEESPEKAAPSVSSSPSPSSTVGVPDSVELTAVGADLTFGDSANVIHEPDQQNGTVLALTVTSAEQGTTEDFSGFILDDYTKAATPYYVQVEVENLGAGDVGGAPVPLWGVDGDNTLLPPASFKTTFKRCPSEPLPKKFGSNGTFSTCLVFLAPDGGTMRAVSFRPNQQFDPIEWTGDITTPEPEPTKKPAPKKKSEKKKQQRG